MPADPLKIVNILTPSGTVKIQPPPPSSQQEPEPPSQPTINAPNNEDIVDDSSEENDSVRRTSTASSIGSIRGYVPPRVVKSEDILFAQPTFSERLFRYLVVIIYLGGLSSLGFFLSIYYIFFWDSRMPPVFKPTKKPPIFIKP